jgi:transposase
MMPGTESTEKGTLSMKPFYMGIDVSKGYADFVIINPQRKPVTQNFQLDDTFSGHTALYNFIARFLSKHPNSKLFAGMESTGGYENNWYNALVAFQGSLNIQTARLNPLGVKHNSQADLKKNTTDKISAQNIAEYLVAHPEKANYQHQDQLAGLRKQWGFVQTLTKQRTQFVNQFKGLLYSSNPELLRYCQTETPAWLLTVSAKYPSAVRLKRAKTGALTKIPYVTLKKARQLVSDAKRSVASATDTTTEQLIVATAQQIVHLNKTIDAQTRRMVEACALPEVELLKTFAGISDKSAIGLMIEIQTIKRFASPKKLASFFGVHPVYKKSGDGVGGIKMSKQGRKQPRHILYMITLAAIKCNPLIKQTYEKHQKNGKHNMSAMGICMHKILRIIYGMLKNKKAFDPKIDIANQHRSVPERNVAPRRDNARRFQAYDIKAPVSRRQAIKRLERDRSHSVLNTKVGITEPIPVDN